MIWQFLINLVEVDEPVGWADTTWSGQRNMDTHGIWFSVKADGFKWVGDAFTALNDEFELNGAEGVATLQINYSCDNGVTYDGFYTGTFDFNTYSQTCGDMCYAECSINPTSCVNKFLNRINIDVDMESTVDLDGNAITPAALDTILLNPQDLLYQNIGTNKVPSQWTSGVFDFYGAGDFLVGLYLPDTTLEGWGIFNAYGGVGSLVYNTNELFWNWANILNYQGVRELSIYERETDPLNCFDSDATIDFRIKGDFTIFDATIDLPSVEIDIVFAKFYTSGYPNGNPHIVIDSYNVTPGTFVPMNTPTTFAFDYTYSNTPAYTNPPADYLLIYFKVVSVVLAASQTEITIDYDSETIFRMYYVANCNATTTEAIRLDNAFCNIWENYLGSEECAISCELPPCLQNIHLTNGLKIRQVLEPQPAKIFLNWEDTFKNLTKIFNFGYGFFDSESSFTVNDLSFWYSDNLILDLGSAREVKFTNATEFGYGVIDVGYSKYELEEVNGLDMICTQRTYRRNPSQINNKLDLISNYITDGYTFEITRQKIQGVTDTQDFRYDNDIYVLHTYQDESGTYPVQGNIDNAANMIGASTRYNFYLTPIRNLMRWFKSIGTIVPDITNTELTFQSGKGNYVAEGQMTGDCSCDGQVIAENETIDTTIYADVECYQPRWRSIYAEFEVPLSVSDWLTIKGDPYGKFSFSCNTNQYVGYLVDLEFNPNDGLGKFKMLLTLSGPSAAAILMEDAGYVLQEDGSYILME